jgi:hypothetical protein
MLLAIANRYHPDHYERIAPDERGWICLEPVPMWLGVTPDARLGYDRLACYDGEAGKEIGDYPPMTGLRCLSLHYRSIPEAMLRWPRWA